MAETLSNTILQVSIIPKLHHLLKLTALFRSVCRLVANVARRSGSWRTRAIFRDCWSSDSEGGGSRLLEDELLAVRGSKFPAELLLVFAKISELVVEVSHGSRRVRRPRVEESGELDNWGSDIVGHVVHFERFLDFLHQLTFLSSVGSSSKAGVLGVQGLEERHERLGVRASEARHRPKKCGKTIRLLDGGVYVFRCILLNDALKEHCGHGIRLSSDSECRSPVAG